MKAKGEYRSALRPIPPADEQVAAILSEGERRFEEMSLSREERARLIEMRRKEAEKKRKAKEKWEEVKEARVSVYLPKTLQQAIKEIAEKDGTSVSQVIAFFLFEALERYERGEIGFWGHKHPSESPRYEWILVHPKDTERTERIESRKFKKS